MATCDFPWVGWGRTHSLHLPPSLSGSSHLYDNIHANKLSFQIIKRFSVKTVYIVPCTNGLCFSSLLSFKAECLNMLSERATACSDESSQY